MGVNMVGYCISDNDVCCEASKQEIIRRYYAALNLMAEGKEVTGEVQKIALLFKQAWINSAYRATTVAAKEKAEQTGHIVCNRVGGRYNNHCQVFGTAWMFCSPAAEFNEISCRNGERGEAYPTGFDRAYTAYKDELPERAQSASAH